MEENLEKSLGIAVTNIAKEIGADCIVLIRKLIVEEEGEYTNEISVRVNVFKKIQPNIYRKVEYTTKIKKVQVGSIVPVKEVLMEAINKDYIKKGEKVVCVEDNSVSTGYKGVISIFDVDDVFFKLSKQNISEFISPAIIDAALEIASEISTEGREGKKVGTSFVIGDHNELSPYLKQLIINPFRGEEKLKVTDPSIKETIKEFAQLDGVFIIDLEGNVVSCGTYLDIDSKDVELPSGFGTRHRASAAITKKTNCVAITVSESGGKIRIFKEGRVAVRV